MTLRLCGLAPRVAMAFAIVVVCTDTTWAQMPGGVQQAVYQPEPKVLPGQVRSADFVDAHGNPAIVPASFVAAHGGATPYACAPNMGGCGPGAYGDVGYGLESGYGDAFAGGYPADQCGPHYFDLGVEYLSYSRDSTTGSLGGLVSLNRTSANTVLSGGNVSDEDAPGFRLSARYDIGPLSVLEATYSSVYELGGVTTFADPNPQVIGNSLVGDLFTVYTNFGTVPNGVTGAQVLTEQALSSTLDFDCDLQTAEISYRRYWVGWSPRVTGTLLAGFRYTRLSEDLTFSTISQVNGNFAAVTETDNDLAGFQAGGDVWVTARQGIRFGGELKSGIYHNRYEVSNYFTGAALGSEHTTGSNVAYLGEARLMVVADVLPSLSLKGGYEVLFMNELALAAENFNTNSPFVGGGRTAAFADGGEATFHGWSFGMEYVW